MNIVLDNASEVNIKMKTRTNLGIAVDGAMKRRKNPSEGR